MMTRQVTIVLGILVIGGGFSIKKYLSNQVKEPKRNPSGGTPTVWVEDVQNGFVKNSISVTGKLISKNRVELFAEVQGKVLTSERPFKEGVSFSQGARLLRIDSTEFKLTLLSSKSTMLNTLIQLSADIKYDFPTEIDAWNAYLNSIEVERPFPEMPEFKNKKFKNFLIARNVYNQYYNIKSQEEKLSKFNLLAPFSGTLAEGNLLPGSMVRAGQKLGTLIQPGDFELEASINLNESNTVNIGDSVRLISEDFAGEWLGRVGRISEHVDEGTQTLKVYVDVSSDKLVEGLYLSGDIGSGGFDNAIQIPRNLLIGTNQVYTVQDTVLALKQVEVLTIGENEVVVRGLENGTKILGQVFSTAYNGMVVNPKLK